MTDAGPPARPPAGVSVVVISKDEPALAETLDLLERQLAGVPGALAGEAEVVVVDASSGRLDAIRAARPWVRWIDFTRPEGVRISIPHQRNRGVEAARGEVVAFTDCGCRPEEGWLANLVAPILTEGEQMACGRTGASGAVDPGHRPAFDRRLGEHYLAECSTINLAFRRQVFEEIGGFDESFEYGSDVDFSWRAVHAGVRIRYVPDAVVLHDWGTRRRQLKRSYAYGKARARLYAKHVLGHGEQSIKKRTLEEHDVIFVAYPLYLLGLPLAVRFRSYLLLPLVALWRNRKERPVQALTDHLVQGAGVLAGAAELVRGGRTAPAGDR